MCRLFSLLLYLREERNFHAVNRLTARADVGLKVRDKPADDISAGVKTNRVEIIIKKNF